MLSVRSCDTWKRHDGEYSSVRCTVYKMGKRSRNKGNPRDLRLITKWIWDALIIGSTPLDKRQLRCPSYSSFHNTLVFSFPQFLLLFVCEPVTVPPLTSEFPESYSFSTTLHSSSFILLSH